eukprot:15815847-Heterocapsa_arctica.AAC.1
MRTAYKCHPSSIVPVRVSRTLVRPTPMLLIGYRSARPARWPMPNKHCMRPTQPVVQNCQTSLANGLA